jgi:peptidoglycan/LPS O-acetylase OafA/YrhL
MNAMSDPQSTSPPPDWRAMRREERYSRRHYRWGGWSWLIGLILIVLGAIFLAQNFGYPVPQNWWAIFILLPAFGALGAAWSMYQRNGGELSPPVTSALVTGVVLAALAFIFLLGVDLGKFWPRSLIGIGIAAIAGGSRWRQNRPPS